MAVKLIVRAMKKSIVTGLGLVPMVIVSVLVWHHFQPPSDAEIHKTVIGTWRNPKGFGIMVLGPDGNYSSRWKAGSRILTYAGAWSVKDGELIVEATKRDAIPPLFEDPKRNAIPFSEVASSKIIRADNHHLVYVDLHYEDHQTNLLTR
jgi:hypothetical protein